MSPADIGTMAAAFAAVCALIGLVLLAIRVIRGPEPPCVYPSAWGTLRPEDVCCLHERTAQPAPAGYVRVSLGGMIGYRERHAPHTQAPRREVSAAYDADRNLESAQPCCGMACHLDSAASLAAHGVPSRAGRRL